MNTRKAEPDLGREGSEHYKEVVGKRSRFHLSEQRRGEEMERAVLPLYEALVQEKSARGLPAKEALQFCKNWVQQNLQR